MPALPIAASRGFSFAEPYAIGMLMAGVAVFVGLGALSRQQGRPFSASLVYLVLGFAAAAVISMAGIPWLDPIDDATLLEKLTELAVIFALFATGLKIDRPFTVRAWGGVGRLLTIAMPLTIAGVACFGHFAMGLSWGSALLLGAVLSPTDPVLAGDIGVDAPDTGEESEPNFAVTGEAGLNDGLAFPFLFAGLFVLDHGDSGWFGEWLLADVLYSIVVAAVIGVAAGHGIAAIAHLARDRGLLAESLDGWLAIPTVLVIYGGTEIAGAYGFIAAFAGGLAFRRHEKHHSLNERVHQGAETVEKWGELVVVLLLGTLASTAGFIAPGLAGWLLAPLLLLVIRPVAVVVAMVGRGMPARETAFVAWFGVRGIGSLYYVAVAAQAAQVHPEDAEVLMWTTIVVMLVSIVAHGTTASPLGRRLLST